MMLGPIFTAELITSGRRRRYFVAKVVYGLVLLTALWTRYLNVQIRVGDPQINDVAAAMTFFFTLFATLQMVAVIVLSPAIVAGMIADERQRRTIEYLFAAPLSNADIVLGKLAAGLVRVASILLVGLPILAIAGLLGGIAPVRLAILFVITLGTMVATGGISIVVSVISRRPRNAIGLAYALLFALLVGPLAAKSLLLVAAPGLATGGSDHRVLDALDTVVQAMIKVNPFAALSLLVQPSKVSWNAMWVMLGSHMLLAAVCTLVAILAVRRAYLRSVGAGQRTSRTRRVRHRQRLRTHPILWKELFAFEGSTRAARVRFFARPLGMLLGLAAIVGSYGLLFLKRYTTDEITDITVWLGTMAACVALLWLGTRAASLVTSERERQTWPTLVSTPLSPAAIVWGKTAGNLYAARWFAALLVGLWLITAYFEPRFAPAIIPMLLALIAAAWFATAVGLNFSLGSRTTLRSATATACVLLFVGGGYMFCVCFLSLPMMYASSEMYDLLGNLFFIPCVPFLLAAPFLWEPEFGRIGMTATVVFFQFVAGVSLYAIAGLLITVLSIRRFDHFTGRVERRASPTVADERTSQTPPVTTSPRSSG